MYGLNPKRYCFLAVSTEQTTIAKNSFGLCLRSAHNPKRCCFLAVLTDVGRRERGTFSMKGITTFQAYLKLTLTWNY